jgi:hypothetical protein
MAYTVEDHYMKTIKHKESSARKQKDTISLSTRFQNSSMSLANFLVRIAAPFIILSDLLTFNLTWKIKATVTNTEV